MRVLLVDDTEDGRRALRLVLVAEGHSVDEAEDVPGALRLAVREPFDAVLVELGLVEKAPGGLGLIGRMSAARPRLATILIAHAPSIELAVEAIRLGAADLLPRPITPERLRRALDRAGQDRDGLPDGAAAPGRPLSLQAIEAEHIRLVLRATPSLNEAAEILGIDPSTLYRKRKRLGL